MENIGQVSTLLHELERIKPHDHLCIIYETPEEWRDAVIPFIKFGLEKGEKCFYIADARTADQVRGYLKAAGIDVASLEATRQLSVLNQSETYTKEGSFDPDRMIQLIISEVAKALAEGYPALRVTGEMSWVLHGLPGSDRLIEYEAKLNRDLFPQYACSALCQYDRFKFDPEIIKNIVLTHPKLIYGNEVYDNIYYIPTDKFLSSKREDEAIQGWLDNLAEQKKAKAVLIESEKKYHTLVNNITLGVYRSISEGDGRFLEVNPAMERITGYSREELLRLPYKSLFFDPAERERALETWAKELKFSQTLYWKRKDGTSMLVQCTTNVIRDNAKNILFYDSVVEDITERKRAEAEILIRQEQLLKFASQVPGMLYQFMRRPNGTYCVPFTNEAIRDMFGCSPDDVKNDFSPIARVILPEDLPKVIASIEYSANNLKPWQCEYRVQLEGHPVHTLLGHSVPEKQADGSIIWYGFNTDITERKQAEIAILESGERFRGFIDSATDGFSLWDKDLRLIEINRVAMERYGYTNKQAILGQSHASVMPVSDEPQYIELLRGVIRTGNPLLIEDATVQTPRGNRHISVRAFKVSDGLGLIGTDITRRIITERKLAEQARELERSNQELQQFAYVVSHDLQEPLRMVSSYVKLLEKRYKDKLDSDANEFIGYAVEGAQRMHNMIQDILKYSRVTTQAKTYELVNSETLLVEVLANLRVSIEENHAVVTHDRLPAVKAEKAQLGQVFQNLIGNAIKFQAKDREPRIHIGAERKDSGWLFSVRDNGIGIEPQYRDKIFSIFQRLHRREKYPGTGIGLAICKKIVELHGGRIWVESEPGKGSTFFFTLPEKE
jgi:PAS domain S-box-containing protein